MTKTVHAQAQMQRRSIPPLSVTWLLDYGAEERGQGGATIYYWDKQAIRDLEKEVGRMVVRRLKSFLDCYIVVADGVIVTAGWRYKKINRC